MGGLAVMALGVWVLVQVTAGDALGRLGLISTDDSDDLAPGGGGGSW